MKHKCIAHKSYKDINNLTVTSDFSSTYMMVYNIDGSISRRFVGG